MDSASINEPNCKWLFRIIAFYYRCPKFLTDPQFRWLMKYRDAYIDTFIDRISTHPLGKDREKRKRYQHAEQNQRDSR